MTPQAGITWFCETCHSDAAMTPQAMIAHLKETHQVVAEGTVKGAAEMVSHSDGADFSSSTYRWAIEGVSLLCTVTHLKAAHKKRGAYRRRNG